MLHCVHQIVSKCVCLLFGDEQVEYRGFLESEPDSKAAAGQLKGKQELTIKLHKVVETHNTDCYKTSL